MRCIEEVRFGQGLLADERGYGRVCSIALEAFQRSVALVAVWSFAHWLAGELPQSGSHKSSANPSAIYFGRGDWRVAPLQAFLAATGLLEPSLN